MTSQRTARPWNPLSSLFASQLWLVACNTVYASLLAALLPSSAHAWAECPHPPFLREGAGTGTSAESLAREGAWFARRKEFPCAINALGKAVVMEPTSFQYNYLLGISLYAADDLPRAAQALKRALTLNPQLLAAHTALAEVYEQQNDRVHAKEQWSLALTLDPKSPMARNALSRDLLTDQNYSAVISLLTQPEFLPLSEDLVVCLSAAYSGSGLLHDATTALQSYMQAHPSSFKTAQALAGVLVLQNRSKEAVDILSPLMGSHPDLPSQTVYLHTLVLAYDPRAKELGRQLLVKAPHQWEILYLVGLQQQQAGNTSRAAMMFRQSIAQRSDFADSHYRYGVALFASGRNAEAAEQLRKAIALGEASSSVHVELAKVLHTLGDNVASQQQLQEYEASSKMQASHAQAAAKADIGDQSVQAGHLQEAAAAYRDASAFDSSEPILRYKLAMVLDKLGDVAGERSALEAAVALNPNMAVAQNQLGYLDSVENKVDDAVRHFQLAVQADPTSAGDWTNFAASLCLVSRYADAKNAINHAIALRPDDRRARQLLAQIDNSGPAQ